MIVLLAQVRPGNALPLIEKDLPHLITGDRSGLLAFGAGAALWTSSSAITAIIDSPNHAYNGEQGRLFWKVRLIAILLTVRLPAFVIEQEWKAGDAGQSPQHIRDLERRQETFSPDWRLRDLG
jgi:uncharacterized BrkB/YihY/UPF0761 family membrane protein